ncbi:unnamed protein product, partial [Vitis vinifera]
MGGWFGKSWVGGQFRHFSENGGFVSGEEDFETASEPIMEDPDEEIVEKGIGGEGIDSPFVGSSEFFVPKMVMPVARVSTDDEEEEGGDDVVGGPRARVLGGEEETGETESIGVGADGSKRIGLDPGVENCENEGKGVSVQMDSMEKPVVRELVEGSSIGGAAQGNSIEALGADNGDSTFETPKFDDRIKEDAFLGGGTDLVGPLIAEAAAAADNKPVATESVNIAREGDSVVDAIHVSVSGSGSAIVGDEGFRQNADGESDQVSPLIAEPADNKFLEEDGVKLNGGGDSVVEAMHTNFSGSGPTIAGDEEENKDSEIEGKEMMVDDSVKLDKRFDQISGDLEEPVNSKSVGVDTDFDKSIKPVTNLNVETSELGEKTDGGVEKDQELNVGAVVPIKLDETNHHSDEDDEEGEIEGSVTDEESKGMVFEGSEAAKHFLEELEQVSGGAATSASSDSGSITITSPDGSRLFSVDRPAGLGSANRSLKPAPRPNRSNLFTPSNLAIGGDSENTLSEEDKRKQEKIQLIRVKFLRLVQRLGRQTGEEFSLDTAKRRAMQLEAEGKDDLNFSLNILVLGKSGVGKSATINSIFGEQKALINAFEPATTTVREIIGTIDGVKIRVFDTPGLKSSFLEQGVNRKILSSIQKFTKKCPPDIVLYVDRLDAQTRDLNDLPLLRTITSSLGPSIWRSAIVTLTHGASAPPDGPSGAPLSYETYVSQRSHVVQQYYLKQSRTHPKLSAEQDEDEYDQLPPFKPLRKSQIAKLSKEQRKAYFEEYDYRDNGGPAAVPVPLPDMVLPPSFDCDNPAYRYRFLEPTSQFLARPVLDTHGWDHDCGYDGVNLEQSLAILGQFPAAVSVQVTKDKKEFNIHLDSSAAAKHGENGSSMAGFDIQNIGKQLAYILRGETKFKILKKNKTAAGFSVTFLGENVATGFKVEDQGDLALGANLQSQFSIGRSSKMAVRVGLNNKLSGQITVKTSSSEQLQIALVGIIPVVMAIYKAIWPGVNSILPCLHLFQALVI